MSPARIRVMYQVRTVRSEEIYLVIAQNYRNDNREEKQLLVCNVYVCYWIRMEAFEPTDVRTNPFDGDVCLG